MFHDTREYSVSRMLMLMNSTQRKLQSEESIYDSDSPLKAIQLLKIAQRLNEELNYMDSAQIRQPLTNFQPSSVVVTSRSIEDEEDEEEEEDPILIEMQSAVEVRHIEDYRAEFDSVEVVEAEMPDSEVTEIRIGHDSSSTTSVRELIESDEATAEVELDALDEADMPMLSRQLSYSSIPSLYHSDHSDEEEDESAEESFEHDHALPRYHQHHHHSLISHPAINLLTKEYSLHHDTLPHHGQAPIA